MHHLNTSSLLSSIQKMWEAGLFTTWLGESLKENKCITSKLSISISMDHLQGVFIAVAVMNIFACLVLMAERTVL